MTFKKMTSAAIAALMLVGCGTATSEGTPAPTTTPEVEVVDESWVLPEEVSFVTEGEDYDLFTKTFEGSDYSFGLVDVLATQVVAGTNHAYLAYGSEKDADPAWYIVQIYENVDETVDPVILTVKKFDVDDVQVIVSDDAEKTEEAVEVTEDTVAEKTDAEATETTEEKEADATEAKDDTAVAADATEETVAEDGAEAPTLLGGYTFVNNKLRTVVLDDATAAALAEVTDYTLSPAAVLATRNEGSEVLLLCREMNEDTVAGYRVVTVALSEDGTAAITANDVVDFEYYTINAVTEGNDDGGIVADAEAKVEEVKEEISENVTETVEEAKNMVTTEEKAKVN